MRHLRPSYVIDAPYAIDAPRTQVWEEVEAAARTEIGAKKLKRLGEPKRTARKKWRAPNLQEEVEDMALVFRDLEEDFDKMRRRCDLGVPQCCGAFTPTTRLVSIRRGRGWFIFRV